MIPKQETFDTAVRGLLLQAKRSIDPGHTGVCMYRAPDGSKCAAGHLLNDDEYKPEFEGYSARSLFYEHNMLQGHDVRLALDLQRAHDTPWIDEVRVTDESKILSDWPRRFREIATKHELSAAVVDELEADFLAKISNTGTETI